MTTIEPAAIPELDLSKPHVSFRYPAFPRFPAEERDARAWIRRMIAGPEPEKIEVAPDLTRAATRWIRSHGLGAGSRIGVQAPTAPEFLRALTALGCIPVWLSRDPEDFESLPRCDAAVLSNPSRADGFFYPQELYLQLCEKLACPVLSDESLALFSFNDVAPGSLKAHALQGHPLFAFAASTYPVMCPQGPEVAWWSQRAPTDAGAVWNDIPEQRLQDAACAIAAFQSRMGSAVEEFTRRVLVAKLSLRVFADAVGPLIREGRLTVPLWPEAGFSLMLNVEVEIKRRGLSSARALAEALKAEDGLCLGPGDAMGAPNCLQVYFAAPPPVMEKLAARLKKAFQGSV